MKHSHTGKKRGLFVPLIESGSVQSAMMVLQPGQHSGEEVENEHPRAEQWLFVVSGAGRARIGQKTIALRTGSLLLIEKGERHRITASRVTALVTLNFYAPTAYTPDGDVKPSVTR